MIYAENKSDFQTSSASPYYPQFTFVLLVFGAVFVLVSAFSFLSTEAKRSPAIDSNSRVTEGIGAIIAKTIFQSRKLIALVSVVYAIIFAFLDGILIYQPTVNFTLSYGVSSPSIVIENCCGPPGYVPVGLAYFPAQHVGVQLIPISILIMILVSLLVGINVALLITSVEKSRPIKLQKSSAHGGKSPILSGVIGAVFGVFAGCPTCAAAFFLSMIAGSGATVFSLAISEFQPVIILVSIPLLIASILWQARSIRTILLGCKV